MVLDGRFYNLLRASDLFAACSSVAPPAESVLNLIFEQTFCRPSDLLPATKGLLYQYRRSP